MVVDETNDFEENDPSEESTHTGHMNNKQNFPVFVKGELTEVTSQEDEDFDHNEDRQECDEIDIKPGKLN